MFKNIPRVADARPACLLAFYSGPVSNKVVIAIEGATSLSQLRNSWSGFLGAVAVPGLQGMVWPQYKTYADQLNTALNLDNDWLVKKANPNCAFIFTGFSLGAGIAEVMAYQFKAANPGKSVFLEKFASPRVGSLLWMRHRNPLVNVHSYYAGNDPVSALPSFSSQIDTIGGVFFNNGHNVTFQTETNNWIVDQAGRFENRALAWNVTNPLIALEMLRREPGSATAWRWHDRHVYRAALQSNLFGSRGANEYRFMGLEHPDENSWQTMFRAGAEVEVGWRQILDPAPDDILPISPAVAALVAAPPPEQPIVPPVPAGWDAIPWGGVDRGAPEPAPRAFSRRRRSV